MTSAREPSSGDSPANARELAGKVAVITGAGSGIGLAIAERFAAEGAAVVINYLGGADEAPAIALAQKVVEEGGRAKAFQADVSKPTQVEAMVVHVTETLGPIDILINNAGIESSRPLLDIEDDEWAKVLAVNLSGAFYCLRACARAMTSKTPKGGSIVNVSSIHEDLPFPGYTPYAVSKGGLRMLMRNAALELASASIRVNNVAPGAISTPINAATLSSPDKRAALEAAIPLRRIGTADEVAQVALFLASDRSSYVTGSTYYVDGGMARFAQPL